MSQEDACSVYHEEEDQVDESGNVIESHKIQKSNLSNRGGYN